MSKMSQLHAELTAQASELGFESLEEAERAGYEVDWGKQRLIPPEDAIHYDWLKERDEVLGGLVNLMVHSVYDYDIVIKAYNFIKERCRE